MLLLLLLLLLLCESLSRPHALHLQLHLHFVTLTLFLLSQASFESSQLLNMIRHNLQEITQRTQTQETQQQPCGVLHPLLHVQPRLHPPPRATRSQQLCTRVTAARV